MKPPSLEGRRPLPPMRSTHQQNGHAPKPKRKPVTTGNRFHEFNEFYDVTLRTVSPMAGLVWFGLWREARPPEWLVTVSQSSLAERIGVSTDTIKRAVKELTRCGLVTVIRRGNSMTGCSTYRIRPKPDGA